MAQLMSSCAVTFPTVVESGHVSHLMCFARSPIFPDQSSHQYQHNYQNCPKFNRNLRGFRKKFAISWSKPRVSFENSRGLGLMVSDNVPAASFGDSGRALLNKEIKEQPSNYAAMYVIHKIHCAKLVLLFSFGPFVLIVGRDGAVKRPIRLLQTPPKRSQPIQCSLGGRWWIFPAQKKGGQSTREKVAIHVAEKQI